MTDLMKDFTDIDELALGHLRDAEKTGDGVQLPFPVPYIYVKNGDAKLRQLAKETPVLLFGGWAVDAEQVNTLVDDGTLAAPPEKWSTFEDSNEKKTWNCYGSRIVTVSVIASRMRWVGKDGAFGPSFDADAGLTRRHLQVLALMYSGGKPYGYVVLSAKGFQAQFVSEAIATWNKAIAPFRKELNATTLPLSAFAITIGTVRPEPYYVTVGKQGASKLVSKIEAHIPADLTAEKVAARFITAQNVRINNERLDMAADWLAAWKSDPVRSGKGASHAEAERDEAEIPF